MAKHLLPRRAAMPSVFSPLGRDMDELNASIRRMFENPFALTRDLFAAPQPIGWMPPVEISETETQLVATVELPGVKPEDVHVSLDDDILTIRGEKIEERTEKDEAKQYHLIERGYGAFQRAFSLPSGVDPEKVSARFDKGVLTVTMLKTKPKKAIGREIKVTAG